MKVIVFSTKRSTHHAFLESVLTGKKYLYENNIKLKDGKECARVTVGEAEYSHFLHIKSFEMNYKIEKALRYYAAQDGWRNATKLAFLRDPLNTLASTLSVYYRRQKEVEWVRKNLGLWCKLYDFIKNGEHDLSFVYANKYWSDSNYRDSVADYFGGGSASIPYVSRFARGGNTFFSRDKKAIVFEDIDNRYSAFQEDQIFKKICAEYYERFDRFLREVGDIKKTEFLKQLVV